MVKQISSSHLAPYHHLIGIGASAICNAYWLFSRLMFRRRNAIQKPHIIVAIAIALLIASNQVFLFLEGIGVITQATNAFIGYFLSEASVLLSSCILVLTFWEGCRNYKKEPLIGKAQRLYFLTVFVIALVTSRIAEGLASDSPQTLELIISVLILFVMLNTQMLLLWKYSKNVSKYIDKIVFILSGMGTKRTADETNHAENIVSTSIAQLIKQMIEGQSLYLRENIKVSDLARELDLPEYIISQTIREDLGAPNFNHYINSLRIKHSQELLRAPENRKKSILTIGFDSGFASVGPFTRTFKAMTGLTPSQYRKGHLKGQ